MRFVGGILFTGRAGIRRQIFSIAHFVGAICLNI